MTGLKINQRLFVISFYVEKVFKQINSILFSHQACFTLITSNSLCTRQCMLAQFFDGVVQQRLKLARQKLINVDINVVKAEFPLGQWWTPGYWKGRMFATVSCLA